jgi:putative transposase
VCAKHNISEPTYYAWKKKCGEMDVSEARWMRVFEEENARLKRLVADLSVQNQVLKEVNSKKWQARRRSDGQRNAASKMG